MMPRSLLLFLLAAFATTASAFFSRPVSRHHRCATTTKLQMASLDLDEESEVVEREEGLEEGLEEEQDAQNERAAKLLEDVRALAAATGAGFQATSAERAEMQRLVDALSACNPTSEPAAAFYPPDLRSDADGNGAGATLRGRWRLIYSDAPDITGLARQAPPLGELVRVGQECGGDTIANVITYRPSGWLRGEEGAAPPSPLLLPFPTPFSSSSSSSSSCSYFYLLPFEIYFNSH